jgi:hypothetical protein
MALSSRNPFFSCVNVLPRCLLQMTFLASDFDDVTKGISIGRAVNNNRLEPSIWSTSRSMKGMLSLTECCRNRIWKQLFGLRVRETILSNLSTATNPKNCDCCWQMVVVQSYYYTIQASLIIRGRYVPLFWTENTEFVDKKRVVITWSVE